MPRPALDATGMKNLIQRASLTTLGIGIMTGGILSAAPGVAAKSTAIVRTGDCSASSDWKLKLTPDDGRLEVEFEVDQNRNGQTWNVVLKHNGKRFWSAQRATKAPSGSFSVRKLTSNAAGADTIVARATNHRTGEACKATVSR